MSKRLRVLMVEDSLTDAELLLYELGRSGYEVHSKRVDTAVAMQSALEAETWDVVLSDYSMPAFTAPAALEVLRATGLDIPFIIVSGTIGEETAVTSLKAGACDFLVKGRLARLVPAIERERREAEQRRQRAQAQRTLEEQLRHAQKMEAVGQLAGGVAHDFNNVLTAILGYSELLAEQIGPDKPIGRDLQEIVHAAQRAAALTRQLLAFSRKQALNPTALSLNAIVEGLQPMLRRLIAENVTIRTALNPDTCAVLADATHLDQVLMNLVVNARDAMPQGGTVTIETRNATLGMNGDAFVDLGPGDYAVLKVSDTGMGMTPEVRARIFEPFFTTKERGHGTGLGLAAVYGIVTQLGGQVNVSSEPGQGATFTIYLPKTDQQPPQVDRLTPRASHVGTEAILLVEDEAAVRSFARTVLERYGYHVATADSSEAALAWLRTGDAVDLLITDVMLTGMDGGQLVRQLRHTKPELRVLFISGYAEPAIRQTLPTGCDLLEKPFTAHTLLARVRQALAA